jgi:hypothetical protein
LRLGRWYARGRDSRAALLEAFIFAKGSFQWSGSPLRYASSVYSVNTSYQVVRD